MFAKWLGRLWHTGDPVVEQSAPAEPGQACVHGVDSLQECGPCAVAAIKRSLAQAQASGDAEAVDRLLGALSAVMARQARLRRSVPRRPS